MRLLLLCCSVISLALSASTLVRVASPQSKLEVSNSYYLDLLRLVLQKTADDFGQAHIKLEPVPESGSLWKLVRNNHRLDVHWLTPTAEIDQQLRVIPATVLYGGLGLRGLMIRSYRAEEFSKVKTLEDLRRFTACQGEQWPDVKVLQHAGLKVHQVQHFDSMLDMLQRGRCDYFPRSVIEGEIELNHQPLNYQGLSFFTAVLLYYPLPVHFYVEATDTSLARRLEQGLRQMHDSGELLNFMQQHSVTRHLFQTGRYSQSVVLQLDNPVLPASYQDKEFQFWKNLLSVK